MVELTPEYSATVIKKAEGRIADIKRDPRSVHRPLIGEPRMSQGAHSEIQAYTFLINLIKFTAGETIIDTWRGACSLGSASDRELLIGVIETYQQQAACGLTCLLSDHLDVLEACRLKISQAA